MTDRAWRSRLRVALANLAGEFWASETAIMATLALLVGAGAGLGAAVMVWAIRFATDIVASITGALPGWPGGLFVILAPAVGGLLVGVILHVAARNQRGLDVSSIIATLASHNSGLTRRVTLAKAAAAVVTIASGGAAGREGPIVHIGAALGAAIGRYYRLNDRRITALVAAGAAGGIAATFSAPLAGVMFALEVILGDFAAPAFGALVVSAASAAAVSRALLGDTPALCHPRADAVERLESVELPAAGRAGRARRRRVHPAAAHD